MRDTPSNRRVCASRKIKEPGTPRTPDAALAGRCAGCGGCGDVCAPPEETKGTGDTPDPGRCAGWTLRWLGLLRCARDRPWLVAGDVCAPPGNERNRGHPGPRTLRWLDAALAGVAALCERPTTTHLGHPAASVSAGRGLERRATAQAGALLHRGVQAGTGTGAGTRVLGQRRARSSVAARARAAPRWGQHAPRRWEARLVAA